MKKNATKGAFLLMILVLLCAWAVTGCEDDPNVEKNIFSFTIGDSKGVIDEVNRRITVTVPAGTDITKLAPVITLSKGAKISPASGAEVDFTNGVNYKVTAENGGNQIYLVTVSTLPALPAPGSLELTVGIVQSGNTELQVYGIPTGGVILSKGKKNSLPDKMVISVGGLNGTVHDDVEWLIDGYYVHSGNIYEIDAAKYTLTIPHVITLIVTKNGVEYSQTLTFTVQP